MITSLLLLHLQFSLLSSSLLLRSLSNSCCIPSLSQESAPAAMNIGRLRFFGPPTVKKERDEDLALFRELFKREREMNMNLLESVSTELMPMEGNSAVYKISTGRKGDFPGNENEKNDYDWLKTPPATPLFQSLEMDVGQDNNPNIIVHKELPIPALKPSRFSEKMEPNQRSKSPSTRSVATLASTSSSRPETPNPKPLQTPKAMTPPITTPRFTAAQRFNKEAYVKPLQTRRFSRPKSPGSLSIASSTASSRPETPDLNPKPPPSRRAITMARGKGNLNPVEKSAKILSKEATNEQKPDPKLKLKADMTKPRPTSETQDSNLELENKGTPKSSGKPIKKSNNEGIAKQNPHLKTHSQAVSPMVRTRFTSTVAGLPVEVPSNLTNSAAGGRATLATRSKLGSSSATKARKSTEEVGGEQEKGNEKRGGNNSGVVIGSSMVEKMMNARKSTAMGKVTAKEEKASKMRGV